MTRILTFTEAILEATEQEMRRNSKVLLLGLGVDDERGLQGTTKGLVDMFGDDRVVDTPLAEEGMTGIAIGMALSGLRIIHNHARMDFLLLAMNQIINVAAKAQYMYGGSVCLPIVIRVLIGDGWGAQHSQGLHSLFAHIPGLKVVAPTTPYDAKGCLISAIRDNNPVIFIEHFNLYSQSGEVPEEIYTVPLGISKSVHSGDDITIIGVSWATTMCLSSIKILQQQNISAEIIDLLSVAPNNFDLLIESAIKTRRVLIVDCAWTSCGISAEIVSRIVEKVGNINIKFRRLGFAPVPSPNSKILEEGFYPNPSIIAELALSMIKD